MSIIEIKHWNGDILVWGANLRGAYLEGAYMEGATYGIDVAVSKTPIQILGLTWPIYVFDTHLKIGCELHTIAEWFKFKNSHISKMDSKALEWWKRNREWLQLLCETRGQ